MGTRMSMRQKVRDAIERMLYGARGPIETEGVFVLGMHRSGTSCLTGLLETSGVRLFRVPRWNRFNPRGNLEDDRVWTLNERLLRRVGGSWRNPPASVPDDAASWSELRAALQPYSRFEPWAIKDPRMVLTLHLWLPVVRRYRCVGTFRHPIAVAESLRTRNKMSLEEGVTLWLHYNRRLIDWHQRFGFPIVSFDLQGDAYLAQYGALCAELGLRYDEAAARNFYCGGFVNHQPGPAERLTGEVAEVYDYLCTHALGTQRRRMAG